MDDCMSGEAISERPVFHTEAGNQYVVISDMGQDYIVVRKVVDGVQHRSAMRMDGDHEKVNKFVDDFCAEFD